MSQLDTLGTTPAGGDVGWADDGGRGAAASANELVVAAARACSEAWSADAALALGDTHEKGEDSLCVGEAA